MLLNLKVLENLRDKYSAERLFKMQPGWVGPALPNAPAWAPRPKGNVTHGGVESTMSLPTNFVYGKQPDGSFRAGYTGREQKQMPPISTSVTALEDVSKMKATVPGFQTSASLPRKGDNQPWLPQKTDGQSLPVFNTNLNQKEWKPHPFVDNNRSERTPYEPNTYTSPEAFKRTPAPSAFTNSFSGSLLPVAPPPLNLTADQMAANNRNETLKARIQAGAFERGLRPSQTEFLSSFPNLGAQGALLNDLKVNE